MRRTRATPNGRDHTLESPPRMTGSWRAHYKHVIPASLSNQPRRAAVFHAHIHARLPAQEKQWDGRALLAQFPGTHATVFKPDSLMSTVAASRSLAVAIITASSGSAQWSRAKPGSSNLSRSTTRILSSSTFSNHPPALFLYRALRQRAAASLDYASRESIWILDGEIRLPASSQPSAQAQ